MEFSSAVRALRDAGASMRTRRPLDAKLGEHLERMALEQCVTTFANYLHRAMNDMREVAAMADRDAGYTGAEPHSLTKYVDRLIVHYPMRAAEAVSGAPGEISTGVGRRALMAIEGLSLADVVAAETAGGVS